MSAHDERALAIFRMFGKHWSTSALPEDQHPVELAMRAIVAGYLASPAEPSQHERDLLPAVDRTLDAYQRHYEAEAAVSVGERDSIETESAMRALTARYNGGDS